MCTVCRKTSLIVVIYISFLWCSQGEFLIDKSIDYCYEKCPAVTFDSTYYFAVWQDDRNGDWDIYGARINQSGIIIDTLGIPISIASRSDQTDPSVAFDGTNYFVIWQDDRFGSWDICGTRVTQSGLVLDTFLMISSDWAFQPREQTAPSVAFGDTNYLVVWQDLCWNYFYDIFGRRVTKSGTVLDENIQIAVENFDQYSPSVAFDGTNYFVVWDNGDVYGKRVTQSGAVLDTMNIPISTREFYQEDAKIMFDGTNYLVAWQEIHDTDDYDIYGTRVQPSGSVLDTNAISIANSVCLEKSPSIAFDDVNYFVTWARDSMNEVDIYGVRVDESGIVLDSTPIRLSSAIGMQYFPTHIYGESEYLCVWEEIDSDSSYGIFGTRVDTAGSVIDTAGLSISPATTVFAQNQSAIAFDGTNCLVVWQDYRNHDWDIYGARIDDSGTVLDSFGIGMSIQANDQKNPCVAFDGTNYFVVWDTPARGTRVNQNGIVLDTNGITIYSGDRPAIAFDGTNYLIAVQKYRYWDDFYWPDIYGLLVDQAGIVINSFYITRGSQNDAYRRPAIVFDGHNYFVVYESWQGGIIRGKRVSQSGVVLDSQGVWISFASPPLTPDVAFDGTNYCVVWCYGYLPGSDIYGAFIDTTATMVDTFSIATAPLSQVSPQIAFDGTGYLVVWQDNRNGDWDIYGAEVDLSGTVTDSFAVVQRSGDQVNPTLTYGLDNQFLITYTGWTDSINGQPAHAMRTWGILSDDIGIEENVETVKRILDSDLSIYPNPLMEECNITYTLSRSTRVKLVLYDVTGRLVDTMVEGHQNAGVYAVRFSARYMPQGIYFLRFSGEDFSHTQKVILVK